jgi:septal ring factor EnvC (AmiA/AmiB activator)
MTCEQLREQVKSLEAEKRDLQEELRGAATSAKPGLANQIKQINKSLALLKKQLKACPPAAGL